MALTKYISDTRLLLNDPFSEIYTDAELTGYINRARDNVASLTECVREIGAASVTAATLVIPFQNIVAQSLPAATRLLSIRSVWIASTGQPVDLRPYEWYINYYLSAGLPAGQFVAAVQRRGNAPVHSGVLIFRCGTFIINFNIGIDGAWLPISLVNDATEDNIPLLWSDSVCYYAAYLSYIRIQRQADANEMLERFNQGMLWSRQAGSPSFSGMNAVDFESSDKGGGGGSPRGQ